MTICAAHVSPKFLVGGWWEDERGLESTTVLYYSSRSKRQGEHGQVLSGTVIVNCTTTTIPVGPRFCSTLYVRRCRASYSSIGM
jgi:hypothetical protein